MTNKRENKFRINGRVIDRVGRHGVEGLRVEAWDKDMIFDDLVGSAATDQSGHFQIELEESYFKEIFLDRRPDIFFKVFDGDTLIKSTEDSVLWNTGAAEIEVLIEVDARIEKSQSFVVKGQISQANGIALAGLLVQAFDEDMRHEELLSETRTDKNGRYEIRYSTEQFRRAEKQRADLTVKVLSDDRKILAASVTTFNASPDQTIDLLVSDANLFSSEYERFMAELEPAMDDVPLVELTAKDVAFLTGETGIEEQYINHLIRAAQWAGQTHIVAGAFYGLLREGLPETLAAILSEKPERQRSALEKAIQHNFIPAALRKEIDKILEQLRLAFVQRMLPGANTEAQAAIGRILPSALPTAEQQSAFLSLWIQHANTDESIDSFWDK
ncbi:MAG TPA: hypothetical protein VF766_00875, partial [Pyrinomonadaceae bacterium]